MSLLAALDLGSNSVKLLLLEARPDGTLAFLAEPSRVTRLAGGVAATGRLEEAAMAETLEAIAGFLRLLPAGRGGRGVAVATSAVRDAVNGGEFLERVRRRLGPAAAPPRLLTGEEEAQTVFAGATDGLRPELPILCIDIGGGSTELAAGGAREGCAFSRSLPLGCVRQGERFGLLGPGGAAPAAVRAAEAAIEELLRPVAGELRGRFGRCQVLATGGTAAVLGRVVLGLSDYDRARLHGLRVGAERIRELAATLLPLDHAARCAVPGLPADRAAVLPAGLLALGAALALLAAESAMVSLQGLRHGLAVRLRRGELAPTWEW
ncbi:MAG: Ppx/GppA family phosphatase [Lentisphaeria bacterium]|jgi:exopolyphosphatase/guanosine-5'-triphosphate,3'-diphosphate pyrophosphatase